MKVREFAERLAALPQDDELLAWNRVTDSASPPTLYWTAKAPNRWVVEGFHPVLSMDIRNGNA